MNTSHESGHALRPRLPTRYQGCKPSGPPTPENRPICSPNAKKIPDILAIKGKSRFPTGVMAGRISPFPVIRIITVLSKMIRNFIFLTLMLLLQACDRKDNVSVTIHVQGTKSSTAEFPSYEKASDWISKSCEPLWHQAKAKGRSARFYVTSTGLELGGIVESPQFGFESLEGNAMRLIQFDETYGNSPKIEGDGLQWHSAESYIKEQIMMNSVFGAHNQKYIENKP